MSYETGSLVNLIHAGSANAEPTVGMGATILGWTDRHAATVVEVPNAKTVVIQRDNAKRTDGLGMSDAQSYDYSPDTDAPRQTFTLRKNGAWVLKGQPLKGGRRIKLGIRDEHYDYSF